ncbi:hypothetical protein [Hymenobacter rubidus]|uniref:hypothetical protein n=1 Tax=Hymenobacter rubidus TaxID=1441626 RepID=UPI00191DB2D4|nr:hypothetical protein [Hymenobacter rubidus]
MKRSANKPTINLSYWTYPEGVMFDDFKNIDKFKTELTEDYDINLESRQTDALGGGLYELAIEIISDFNFKTYALEIIRDNSKTAIVAGAIYFWKPLMKKIKALFAQNTELSPNIESALIKFKDTSISIYSIYPNGISEIIDDIIPIISEHYIQMEQKSTSHIKSIHIPIFNQVDTYSICAYRVKLNVDENIPKFDKGDYYKIWGIEYQDGTKAVYEVNSSNLINAPFYTQSEYDELLEKKFESEY